MKNEGNGPFDFTALSEADAPRIKVTPPGPESEKYLDYQKNREGSAVSYPRGLPMAMKRGKGATVEDVDGNVYLDFFAGAGVLNVGHSNPLVVEAVENQIRELTHSLDIPNPSRKDLVEVLMELLPGELSRVFFGGPTGSDAVEAAIKLAKYNSRRTPIIAFEGSYHGMSAGALTLCSGTPFKEDFLPLIPEVHFLPFAYCYRCPFARRAESCDLLCAQYLQHKLEDPHSGLAKPAAVIIEAIQGEGGSIIPPDGYLKRIREICDRFDILLIVDEIQAGFCRTGRMFAFQHSEVIPDIITMSKALGGIGLPISAIAYRENLNTFPPGKHIGTFRGNVVAYAAGQAALRFMIANNLAQHATKMGNQMLSQLKSDTQDLDIIGDVRGKGLMLGVEFVKDRDTKEPAAELAAEVRTRCHQKGLLIEIGGHFFNVARFLPPLILTPSQAEKGMEIFCESVAEVVKS